MTAFQPWDRVHLRGHEHAPATTGTVVIETLTAVHVMWDDNRAITPHNPQHLEPAGEPMQTPFKSRNEGKNNTVTIRPTSGAGVYVSLTNHDRKIFGCEVDATDAPALCLAILKAAGWTADDNGAINELEVAIEHQESIAKAEKIATDRAVVDAEAFALYLSVNPMSAMEAFGELTLGLQSRYRRAALKARELHRVTK